VYVKGISQIVTREEISRDNNRQSTNKTTALLQSYGMYIAEYLY